MIKSPKTCSTTIKPTSTAAATTSSLASAMITALSTSFNSVAVIIAEMVDPAKMTIALISPTSGIQASWTVFISSTRLTDRPSGPPSSILV